MRNKDRRSFSPGWFRRPALGAAAALALTGLSSLPGCQSPEEPIQSAKRKVTQNGPNATALIGATIPGEGDDRVFVDRMTFTCAPPPPDHPNPPTPDEQWMNCAQVRDGCVVDDAEARLLHFSAATRNDGDVAFDLPEQPAPPPVGATPETFPNSDPTWVWSWSHDHYHLRDYGVYTLVDATVACQGANCASRKTHVGTGRKFSFAVADLQPGALDVYPAVQGAVNGGPDVPLPCQFINIDNVPDGIYNLVQQVNVSGSIPEERPFDNTTATRIEIAGDVGEVVPRDQQWDPSPTLVVPATGVVRAPAVVTRDVNTYELFFTGADGKLYTRRQETSGSWSPAGGSATAIYDAAEPYTLTGPPAAMARKVLHTDASGTRRVDRLDVFARAATGHLYTFWWKEGGSWAYYVLGSQAAGSPAAVAANHDRMMVAWIGTDGQVRYRYNGGFAWAGATTLTGATFPADQAPALVASDSRTIHLFARAANGAVKYRRHVHGSGFGAWQDLGGSVVGTVALASNHVGRVDIFARGSDDSLLHKTWSADTDTFSAWIDQGAAVDSVPTVISTGSGSLDVFYYHRSPTPASPLSYVRRHFDGAAWSVVEDLGTHAGLASAVPIVASSWADHTLDVFLPLGEGGILARSLR